ncbi:MAG TPA: hypothetical protein VKS20_15015 [Candidatus Acidoferrales bacterium]|nr:hypothetical protein [Candidatus Acidoferrales bacterium]
MSRTTRKALIAEIEQKRKSRLLCYLTSDRQNAVGQIAKDAIPLFFKHLNLFEDHTQVDVLVCTLGGDTLAAFGLSRLIREFTKNVRVLVPEKCHSGGTLFALGANEILMTKAGTLSPIDPSITSPLNPAIELMPGQRQLLPVSVESVAGFKALIEEDWGIKSEEHLIAGVKMLADRVHPLALGDVFRSRQQIQRFARVLLASHRTDKKRIDQIIKTLVAELGSHDYLISRQEARKLFGRQIAGDSKENKETEDLTWSIYEDFAAEMELGVEYNPQAVLHSAQATSPGAVTSVILRLAAIESLARSDFFEQEFNLSSVQTMTPAGLATGIQQQLVRSGWRTYPFLPCTNRTFEPNAVMKS